LFLQQRVEKSCWDEVLMKLKRFPRDERGEVSLRKLSAYLFTCFFFFVSDVNRQMGREMKQLLFLSYLKEENVMMIMILFLTSRMIKITHRIIHNAIPFHVLGFRLRLEFRKGDFVLPREMSEAINFYIFFLE
jgi:hypothetical protein